MIKLSDYIMNFMEQNKIKTIFTLTGGGIMHLVESLGKSNIDYVCCHHEQACAIAAQAYSMYNDQLGVCLVTTGPGGTNALTGAAASYVDSTPVLFLSGQVKREDFASKRHVRQFGAQENDIISMVKSITKYAVTVMEPNEILYHLQKAVYLALSGRKGPVWIDIPLDIQSELIDENNLIEYKPFEIRIENRSLDITYIEKIAEMFYTSKRPLILVGHGVKASNAESLLYDFVKEFKIPVLSTWRAAGLFDYEDEIFFGSPGLQAPRYSNLILQGCDFLLVLGSRLDNMITAFSEEHFAFRSNKVVVDIDEFEILKLKMQNLYPIVSDVKSFLESFLNVLKRSSFAETSKWIDFCRNLKNKFPIFAEKQGLDEGVDLYQVTDSVSKYCGNEDTIVVSSTSRCNTAGHIAFRYKKGQKPISSMGMGSMGFALPSAVGAYFASDKKRVIMIEGDGSFQLNLQELQTICYHQIPVKMFIFNNNGYAAITTMQDRNFDKHYVGSNPQSGLDMPNFEKIAYAYGIRHVRIEKDCEIESKVKECMKNQDSVICEIIGSLYYDEIPKCISSVDEQGKRISAFLENPYPFLTEEELNNIYKAIL